MENAIIALLVMYVTIGYVIGQDCGSPTRFLSTDNSCTDIKIGFENTEYVRYECISFLIRTAAKIDYCPVELCNNGTWSHPTISCGSSECFYVESQTYDGRRTCTDTGYTCQRWDSQFPNEHPYNETYMFPENNVTEAGSYCRDPNGVDGKPWCYTTDPNVPWDYCDIPECANVTIDQGRCPGNYCGDLQNTISTDNVCLYLWPISASYPRHLGATIPYRCVTLLAGFQSAMSYCPVQVCGSDFYWNNVTVTCGENECYNDGQSELYAGGRECTKTGRQCQYWSSQTPHPHNFTTLDGFPDANADSQAAHCRDPGGVRLQPWCYTTDPDVEWEYCDILNCSDMIANAGQCGTTGAIITVTPTTAATTTTVAVTTTGPGVTATMAGPTTTTNAVPAPPVVHTQSNGTLYEKITNRVGFDLVGTIPLMSSLDCCRQCTEVHACVMATFDAKAGTCKLYMENPNNHTPIECNKSIKCYLLQYLV